MRPRQFDDDAVLDTVFEHFWERGVRASSMADLARATGLQRGSLYNAFGSKEKLFIVAHQRYARRYLATVDRAMAVDGLDAQLMGYCRASIDNFCAGSPARSCPTTRGLMEVAPDNREGLGPGAQDCLAALIRSVVDRVEAAFARAKERDEFVGDGPAAARQLVATVRGLVILERAAFSRDELLAIARRTVTMLVTR